MSSSAFLQNMNAQGGMRQRWLHLTPATEDAAALPTRCPSQDQQQSEGTQQALETLQLSICTSHSGDLCTACVHNA